jgi:hypothetical protein
MHKNAVVLFYILMMASIWNVTSYAESDVNLLGLTDRGSITNTPYTIDNHVLMLETGYDYERLTPFGELMNGPQLNLFLGLPAQSEFIAILPNYNQSNYPRIVGSSSTTFGIKHQFANMSNWSSGVEALTTIPGGSRTFGNGGWGIEANGLLSYQINSQASIGGMLGVSSSTTATDYQSLRFESANASVVFTLSATDRMNLFIELFGQSKTAPMQRGNFNVDCGMLYLATTNLVFDLEIGQQLTNTAGVFQQFLNTGITIRF